MPRYLFSGVVSNGPVRKHVTMKAVFLVSIEGNFVRSVPAVSGIFVTICSDVGVFFRVIMRVFFQR